MRKFHFLLLFVFLFPACERFKPLGERALSKNDGIRESALQKISRLKEDKKGPLAAFLASKLNDPEPRIVNRATEALSLTGQAGSNEMKKYLNDPDAFVRLSAVTVLGKIEKSTNSDGTSLLAPLTDSHPLVREEALLALLKKNTLSPEVLALVSKTANDPDPSVKQAAQKILDKHHPAPTKTAKTR